MTISEMAKECGCTYRDVYDVILKNNITPISYDKKKYRDYAQIHVDFIYKTLYFERKCDVVVFESKMNKQESFEEFKIRTYGKNTQQN